MPVPSPLVAPVWEYANTGVVADPFNYGSQPQQTFVQLSDGTLVFGFYNGTTSQFNLAVGQAGKTDIQVVAALEPPFGVSGMSMTVDTEDNVYLCAAVYGTSSLYYPVFYVFVRAADGSWSVTSATLGSFAYSNGYALVWVNTTGGAYLVLATQIAVITVSVADVLAGGTISAVDAVTGLTNAGRTISAAGLGASEGVLVDTYNGTSWVARLGTWSINSSGTITLGSLAQISLGLVDNSYDFIPHLRYVGSGCWFVIYTGTSLQIIAQAVALSGTYSAPSVVPPLPGQGTLVVGDEAMNISTYVDPFTIGRGWLVTRSVITPSTVIRLGMTIGLTSPPTLTWDFFTQTIATGLDTSSTSVVCPPNPTISEVDVVLGAIASATTPFCMSGVFTLPVYQPATPVLGPPGFGSVINPAVPQTFEWTVDPAENQVAFAYLLGTGQGQPGIYWNGEALSQWEVWLDDLSLADSGPSGQTFSFQVGTVVGVQYAITEGFTACAHFVGHSALVGPPGSTNAQGAVVGSAFTVEFLYQPSAADLTTATFLVSRDTSAHQEWAIYLTGGNLTIEVFDASGIGHAFGGVALTAGANYAVALTWSGTTWTLWLNGASVATLSLSTARAPSSQSMILGAPSPSTTGTTGYMAEVRVSDTARYSTSYTPATAPFVSNANTGCLYHLDAVPVMGGGTQSLTIPADVLGPAGTTYYWWTLTRDPNLIVSQVPFPLKMFLAVSPSASIEATPLSFIDSGPSGQTLTATGTVGLVPSPAGTAFGSAAQAVSSGSFLSGPVGSGNAQGAVTGSAWTCEFIYEAPSFATTPYVIGRSGEWQIVIDPSGAVQVIWYDSGGTSHFLNSGSHLLTAGVANNVAVSYNGADVAVWVNGTYDTDYAMTSAKAPSGSTALVVFFADTVATSVVDEVRISDSVRYTFASNYTPATIPFTSDVSTGCLYHLDDVVGTSQPTIQWTFTAGTMGGIQTTYQVLIGPTGWDPATTTPTWSTPITAGQASSATVSGLYLPQGTYDVYVVVTETSGATNGYDDFATFTIVYTAPATPSLTATATLGTYAGLDIVLALTGATVGNTAEFQYSLNAGSTWADVRNGSAVPVGSSGTAGSALWGGGAFGMGTWGAALPGSSIETTLDDYDMAAVGTVISYRVRQITSGGLVSAWSSVVNCTCPAFYGYWWLKDPINPVYNAQVQLDPPYPRAPLEVSSDYVTLGGTYEVIVSDGMRGATGSITFTTMEGPDGAPYDIYNLLNLLIPSRALLLQGPFGDSLYVWITGAREIETEFTGVESAMRKTTLKYVQIARP
jgi:hypothetical protein